MTRPTHETPEGRTYLALQARARELQRGTAEIFLLYALERFLVRLGASAVADRMILKGGMLMAAYGQRRPTRNVDLLALRTSNEPAYIAAIVREVASLDLGDGLHFDVDSLDVGTIREGARYAGVRVGLRATLATAKMTLHVDVNVGDPVEPPPTSTPLPSVMDGEPIHVLAYPVQMVIAETLVTAVERGGLNTRWRDFADLLVLRGHLTPDVATATAIRCVAAHRGVTLVPFSTIHDQFAPNARASWAAWRRKQGLMSLPQSFDDVLKEIRSPVEALLASAMKIDSDSNPESER